MASASQTCIDLSDIQLDGVPLQVDEESTTSCDTDGDGNNDDTGVEVSNSGQFVAAITMWPESMTADNTDVDLRHSQAGRRGQRWLRR